MGDTPNQRPILGIKLTLGLLSVPVDVMSAVPSERRSAGGSKMICGICVDAEPPVAAAVTQRYVCEHDHLQLPADTARAREIDGTLVPVAKEALAEVRTGGVEVEDSKDIELHVWPAEDVSSTTRVGGALYRLRPPRKASTQARTSYAVMMAMAEDPDYALVGEMAVKGAAKPYRVDVWHSTDDRSQLCLTELMRPDDLAPADDMDLPEPTEKVLAMAASLLEAMVDDFDPADLRNLRAERAEALDEALASGDFTAAVAIVAPVEEPELDLEALLEATLAGTKLTTNRKPRKSSPRKRTPRGASNTADLAEIPEEIS